VVLVRGAVREDEIEELQRERSWDRASDTGPLGEDGRTMQPSNTTSNINWRYLQVQRRRATMAFSSNRNTDVHWRATGCIDTPMEGL